MFVFIGSVKPQVTSKEVDKQCPSCGRLTIQENQIDQVLSLFFIPLFTVHRGQPYCVCPNCGWDFRQGEGRQLIGRSDSELSTPCDNTSPHVQFGRLPAGSTPSAPDLPLDCIHCGNPVKQSYLFCPFCGTFLKD